MSALILTTSTLTADLPAVKLNAPGGGTWSGGTQPAPRRSAPTGGGTWSG